MRSSILILNQVHVTGIGTYRLRRIEECNDPCPRRVQRNNSNSSNTGTTNTIEPLAVADMERQDSLGKYSNQATL